MKRPAHSSDLDPAAIDLEVGPRVRPPTLEEAAIARNRAESTWVVTPPPTADAVLGALPGTEREVARRLGVSTGSARSVLCRLLREGQVKIADRQVVGNRVVAIWGVPSVD